MMALLPNSAPALKSVEAAPPSAVQNLPSSSHHELPTRLKGAGSSRRTAVQRLLPHCRNELSPCTPDAPESDEVPAGNAEMLPPALMAYRKVAEGCRPRPPSHKPELPAPLPPTAMAEEPGPGRRMPCRSNTCRAEPSRTNRPAPAGSRKPPRSSNELETPHTHTHTHARNAAAQCRRGAPDPGEEPAGCAASAAANAAAALPPRRGARRVRRPAAVQCRRTTAVPKRAKAAAVLPPQARCPQGAPPAAAQCCQKLYRLKPRRPTPTP